MTVTMMTMMIMIMIIDDDAAAGCGGCGGGGGNGAFQSDAFRRVPKRGPYHRYCNHNREIPFKDEQRLQHFRFFFNFPPVALESIIDHKNSRSTAVCTPKKFCICKKNICQTQTLIIRSPYLHSKSMTHISLNRGYCST